jgi:hypothetical protein
MIAIQIQIQLAFLHLGFLKTKEIRIQGFEDFLESFSITGPKPIHIP